MINELIFGKTVHLNLSGVACRYYFFDVNKPLVVCFSNAGSVAPLDKVNSKNGYTPWGFEFVKKQNVNVICFASIDKPCWYLKPEFQEALKKLATLLNPLFKIKLGYAGSMGGMLGAFASLLCLDRILLLNPISTVDPEKVAWEKRFNYARSLDWYVEFNDASTAKCKGYIVYDNLYNLDKNHAKRFPKNFKHLVVPGVGHCMPEHLLRLGILKELFNDFLHDRVCENKFREKAKQRRHYYRYYEWLLSNQNRHKTEKRVKVIKLYRHKVGESKINISKRLEHHVDKLREVAIELESIDLELSLRLMTLAKEARPEGKFISDKVSEYEQIILIDILK